MKKQLLILSLAFIMSFVTLVACIRPGEDERTFRIAFDMQREWEEEFGFSYPQVALVARRELADNNANFVNQVAKVIENSINFARNNAYQTAYLARDVLEFAEMPERDVIESFIDTTGQDVFNFQGVIESKEAIGKFLTELHSTLPAFVGGQVPSDNFYFNPLGNNTGNVPNSVSLYVPIGAPILAATYIFQNNPTISYDNRQITLAPSAVVATALGPTLARPNNPADFALVPINLAATRFNNFGDYVVVGVAMWGIFYIVENHDLTGGVTNLNDLKGEIIYTFQPTASPRVVLQTVLEANGLEVNFINLPGVPPNSRRDDAVNIYFMTSWENVYRAMLGRIMAYQDVRFALLAEPYATSLTLRNADDIYLESDEE
ncbi:MAG: hypothetical protein FWE22_07815 [Firmicutes bacterium]|nr:hypothetical protein [Bacillota bacterium]